MNKKHFILPIIVLLLYFLSVWAMSTRVEPYATERFNTVTLIEKQMRGMTPEERTREMQRLDEKITELEEKRPEITLILASLFEKLTFGRPNCLSIHFREPCGFYTTELLVAAQENAKLVTKNNQFQYATKYTIFDHVQKIITLMIEAFLFSLIIGYSLSKKEQIKRFYAFTKFRAITTVILFVLVIGPTIINDDWFFAAPWIWYILAPPTIFDYYFGHPGNLLTYIITWILMILWFYTLATIIDKVRKSR